MYLYYTLAALSLTPLASTAAVFKRQAVYANVTSGWTYQGCYSDSVSNRALSGSAFVDSSGMTEEVCVAYCAKAGYTFAGVEYGDECYCDYQLISSSVKESSTDCNMPCAGNAAEVCGAGNRLTVFSTSTSTGPVANPGPNGWTSLGCYDDSSSARTLQNPEGVPAGGSGMTVAQCTTTCQTYGFQYAGVEYGGECYCDNSIKNGAKSVSDGCNMPCTGNSSEYCGGPNRLNVYQLPSAVTPSAGEIPAGWSSVGCFADSVSTRTLTQGQAVTGGYLNMTISNCLSACQVAGYDLAGVEYSQECYCGTQLENGGSCALDQTTCDMPCKGNSAETCGGPNRLNVYQYGSSSAVASCPATPGASSSTATTISTTSSTTTTSSLTTSTPSTASSTTLTTISPTTTPSSSSSQTSSSQPSQSASAWCPSGLSTTTVTESATTYTLTCGSTLTTSPFATAPEASYTSCVDWCNSWGPTCATAVFSDPSSAHQNCLLYSSSSTTTITTSSNSAIFVKSIPVATGPWCPPSLTASGPLTQSGVNYVATCGTGVSQGQWLGSSPMATYGACLGWCNSWGSYCAAATFQTDTYENCNLYVSVAVGGTVKEGDMALFVRA